MGKDNVKFQIANDYVVNKDKSLSYYIQYMLSRTQSMFAYTGLPDTIPQSKLELMLQTKGYAFITEIDGKLYALHGSLGGMLDVYEDYTEITVANTALNLSKTFNLESDGVLIDSDTMRLGLLPILSKYGAMLAENTITIHTVDIILRMVTMISASDDRTFTGAEKFIKDIENGKISAIGESAFFEGIRVHSVANSQNYLNQFIELEQYLKASCFNEIGLNANFNMKNERLTANEVSLNDDFLLPLVDNMMKCRQTAIEKINEKYGTEITLDYASAWKVTNAENEKQIAISESLTEQIDSGDIPNITIDERKGVHDTSSSVIELNGGENNDNSGDTENRPTGDIEETDTTTQDGMESENATGERKNSVGESENTSTPETDESTQGTTDTYTDDEESGDIDESDTERSDNDTEIEESEDKDNDRNKG